jgi:hypothetical protein
MPGMAALVHCYALIRIEAVAVRLALGPAILALAAAPRID